MKLKTVFKNLAFIFFLPIASTLSGISSMVYFDETLKYMDPASLPENGVGIILLPFLGFIFGMFLAIFFGIFIFGLQRNIKLSYLWFQKDERKPGSFVRCIGYLFILRLIYEGIRDWIEYKVFVVSGLLFYAVSIIFVLILTLVCCSIIFKYEEE
ncbi:MAG: hypothetical protein Q4G33_12585 [bacterium]|nr:hypothetical protein [bacterium]